MIPVDSHAHVLRRDAPLVPGRHSSPKRDAPVEQYLGILERHGIGRAVLTAPSFYGTDNSLLLSTLDAHPDRLRGTVIVEPTVPGETLAALDRRGVVGVRLNWVRRSTLPEVTGADYRRLFALVRELDWHVEIFVEGEKLARLLPAVRDCGVKVVLDHFGNPDPAKGLSCPGFREALEGVRAGDTWVKLSAGYRLGGVDPRRYAGALLEAGGASRLLWASDWPFISFEDSVEYGACLGEFARWVPDDRARHAILCETPARLFRFESAANGAESDPSN